MVRLCHRLKLEGRPCCHRRRLRASKDGPGYEFIGELRYGAAQLFTGDAKVPLSELLPIPQNIGYAPQKPLVAKVSTRSGYQDAVVILRRGWNSIGHFPPARVARRYRGRVVRNGE